MRSDILGGVAVDLLSIPSLVFRIIRKKLINATLADIDVDIKFPHFEIMMVLKEEGTLHPAEIGGKLLIAKAQMTHLLDKLVGLNLVEREMDSTDRRTLNIALTDKGRKILEIHENNIINAVREYISCLEDGEIEDLSHSLRTLRDTLLKLQ
ncbi:MAG: MarR family transcriptional regulator [Dehalococcoidales bacterium]|nr:MarR family transcriptional regulator [Dehalococcoidales bacterium]